MSNIIGVKLTELPSTNTLVLTDFAEIVQDGVNKRITLQLIRSGLQPTLGFTPEDAAKKGAANGYASLGPDRKLLIEQVPEIEIGNRYFVDAEADLGSLTAEPGDIGIVTDPETGKSDVFMLTGPTALPLTNWTALGLAKVGVESVNGKTGVLTLTLTDITDSTAFGRALLSVADAQAARTALGLGSAALKNEADFSPANHTHNVATAATPGFMSGADKAKIDYLSGAFPGMKAATLVRFPLTLKAIPAGYIELTDQVQTYAVGALSTLDAVLNTTVVLEGGTPTIQQTEFRPEASTQELLGSSVAIGRDGTVLVASGPNFSTGKGRISIWQKTNGAWPLTRQVFSSTQLDPLTGDTTNNAEFGAAVCMDDNADYIFAGATGIGVADVRYGLYTFKRESSGEYSFVSRWRDTTIFLNGVGTQGIGFSREEALTCTPDGTTIVAGSLSGGLANQNNLPGYALVFKRVGDTVSLFQAIPSPRNVSGEAFGRTVAVSADGNTVLVGASTFDQAYTNQGCVYVFRLEGGTYVLKRTLLSPVPVAQEQFGTAVAISGDGTRIAVSAAATGLDGFAQVGVVYLFEGTSQTATYAYKQTIRQPNTATASGIQFAYKLALSRDGTRLLVGAQNSSINSSTSRGAVLVYDLVDGLFAYQRFHQIALRSGSPRDGYSVKFDGASRDRYAYGAYMAQGFHTLAGVVQDTATNAGRVTLVDVANGNQTERHYVQLPAKPDNNWRWAIKL